MDAVVLEQDSFESWLCENSDTGRVFAPRDCFLCPIARYLSDTLHLLVIVEDTEITLPNDDPDDEELDQYELPQWAQEFVQEVDKRNEALTTQDALHILGLMAIRKERSDA
jgi:hypothetical protein